MDRKTWNILRKKQTRITKREESLNDLWFEFFKNNTFTDEELEKMIHQVPASYPRFKIVHMILDRKKGLPNEIQSLF